MIGRVDHRDRPIIELKTDPSRGTVPALLDTGFNGCLITNATNYDRLRDFGFECILKNRFQRIETVGAAPEVQMGTARILWHGLAIRVPFYVVLSEDNSYRAGDPLLTLGTGLLVESKLTINFPERTLMVEGA